jgi:hypothetical protein
MKIVGKIFKGKCEWKTTLSELGIDGNRVVLE